MNSKSYFLPNADGSQTVVLGPSGQPKSVLDNLTPEELKKLSDWSDAQSADSNRGGSIDLMQWPGWKDAMERRLKALSGADETSGS